MTEKKLSRSLGALEITGYYRNISGCTAIMQNDSRKNVMGSKKYRIYRIDWVG